MPEGMGRAAFPKGDTAGKLSGETGRTVGGTDPTRFSPVGSHPPGTELLAGPGMQRGGLAIS